MRLSPLPIDSFVEPIVEHLRASRAVVVTAQPGAGKTTRVPPALVEDGPVILLQPRRVAARAIAQRIASERHWTVGEEVGWQIRFERRFGARTRLLVATEGVLTERLLHDPLLSDFRTIVLDEFHERSVHCDLGIALARQAWRARADLRIAVMSATLDAAAVAAYLDGCPIVEVPGRTFPIDIEHTPGAAVADAAIDMLAATDGTVLCFLPGAFEIERTIVALTGRDPGRGVDVVPLHGSLESAAQDAAIQPPAGSRRKIVVATNIAETSLTVPEVTAVVDTGLHKVARFDAERAIDSLSTERITADAADQRAGRAGRVAPGRVRRLWDASQRLRPHREPELFRIDLSAIVLDVIAWGGDPHTFEWFEQPRAEAIEAALTLLTRLGALREGGLTSVGNRLRRLPLHPRLARMLVEAEGAPGVARACALLSERRFLPPSGASTTCDLWPAIDRWAAVPPHVQRVAREIERMTAASGRSDRRFGDGREARGRPLSDIALRRAVLAAYPDRVAARREPGSKRVRLASGAGAVLGRESGVTEGEFLVALDVQAQSLPPPGSGDHAGRRREDGEATIRIACRVEREWLVPNFTGVVHWFDRTSGTVKAMVVERYDALVLAERPTVVDKAVAAEMLAAAWIDRGPGEADEQLLRRLRFAGCPADVGDLVRTAFASARALDDVDLREALAPEVRRQVERDAPETLTVPSGRTVRLAYNEDGSVSASVKLQELFGLAETPRIGRRREPLLFALLAPNGRPVQMTRDLRSFWDRTYPEVRKELRGRYPKHPWPEDPWHAAPSARPVSKRRR